MQLKLFVTIFNVHTFWKGFGQVLFILERMFFMIIIFLYVIAYWFVFYWGQKLINLAFTKPLNTYFSLHRIKRKEGIYISMRVCEPIIKSVLHFKKRDKLVMRAMHDTRNKLKPGTLYVIDTWEGVHDRICTYEKRGLLEIVSVKQKRTRPLIAARLCVLNLKDIFKPVKRYRIVFKMV